MSVPPSWWEQKGTRGRTAWQVLWCCGHRNAVCQKECWDQLVWAVVSIFWFPFSAPWYLSFPSSETSPFSALDVEIAPIFWCPGQCTSSRKPFPCFLSFQISEAFTCTSPVAPGTFCLASLVEFRKSRLSTTPLWLCHYHWLSAVQVDMTLAHVIELLSHQDGTERQEETKY